MKEVGGELILALLEFFLGNLGVAKNGDVKSILLASEQVLVEEVDHLARVLPGPSTEDTRSVDGGLLHVVIEEGIEVKVGHAAHLALKSSHLELCLVVHLTDELLRVLKLHGELFLLLSVEIWSLLLHK